MKRRLKPRNKATFFHITVRTAQKEYWLADDKIKQVWENKLFQLSEAYYIEIYAHAILSNHVHLVLKINCPEKDVAELRRRFEVLESTLASRRKWHDEWSEKIFDRFTDLSCFMRDLNQWFAAWHNKHAIEGKVTSGHLWGRRFFSKVVSNDQYLLTAMSYVDLNPVRAGLVKKASQFEFSSAGKLQLQLSQGKCPEMPAVGWLKHLRPENRAEAYLIWLDFLADFKSQAIAKKFEAFAVAIEKEKLNIEEIRFQIINKEPSNWSTPTFASPEFSKAILIAEGWLPTDEGLNSKNSKPEEVSALRQTI